MSCWILKNKHTGKFVFSTAENYAELEKKLESTDVPFEVLGIAEDFEGLISIECECCAKSFKIWKFEKEICCEHCGKKQTKIFN